MLPKGLIVAKKTEDDPELPKGTKGVVVIAEGGITTVLFENKEVRMKDSDWCDEHLDFDGSENTYAKTYNYLGVAQLVDDFENFKPF